MQVQLQVAAVHHFSRSPQVDVLGGNTYNGFAYLYIVLVSVSFLYCQAIPVRSFWGTAVVHAICRWTC